MFVFNSCNVFHLLEGQDTCDSCRYLPFLPTCRIFHLDLPEKPGLTLGPLGGFVMFVSLRSWKQGKIIILYIIYIIIYIIYIIYNIYIIIYIYLYLYIFILYTLYLMNMMNMVIKVEVFRRCPEVLNFIPSCCVQTWPTMPAFPRTRQILWDGRVHVNKTWKSNKSRHI